MNINLTLVVQMLVFALLIYGTMKWIWPPLLTAMQARERKIAEGLAAAEKGEQELADARGKADAIVREARERANQIIDHAQHRANELVEQARGSASSEGARLLDGLRVGARDSDAPRLRDVALAERAEATAAP